MHNYGFTILELNIKQKIILKLAKWYEYFFAQRGDFHFCVSKSMKKDLEINWKINAICLYDKSNNDIFSPISIEEKHYLLKKLNFYDKNNNDQTIITKKDQNNKITQNFKERNILIVSSTSWTKDEDFGILFNALIKYEEYAKNNLNLNLPKINLMITGKGPEKQKYEEIISNNKNSWHKIQINTLWLEPNDYPLLLASADLGICLHYSSSGLDLPMKVVDMLGCGLPVLAIKYNCIDELVTDNFNGRIFNDSNHLFNLLIEIFEDYPKNSIKLEEFRKNALKFRDSTFSNGN